MADIDKIITQKEILQSGVIRCNFSYCGNQLISFQGNVYNIDQTEEFWFQTRFGGPDWHSYSSVFL